MRENINKNENDNIADIMIIGTILDCKLHTKCIKKQAFTLTIIFHQFNFHIYNYLQTKPTESVIIDNQKKHRKETGTNICNANKHKQTQPSQA